ncbi:ATP synthase mitochondrial F1 complex assembly factor 1-like [Bufo gargarizans]|uniref:ATP synthase mitochondrial F1 complex assembly factor 1-like n=1 Tax=Bufo gargarizans TaxID=30331 RepID=UPI001CF28BD0|nr:ATP synthase mitochondrial F1 complex assembly factor 1-like [Bufo gargarizans]
MCPEGDGVMAAAVVQMRLGYRGLLAVRSRVAGPVALGLVSSQLRTFSVRKEREMEENPFYGKYKEKIEELRRSDPGAFDARMEKRKEVRKQPLGSSDRPAGAEVNLGSVRESSPKNKTLNSLLNMEMVKDKSAEDIAQIWTQYFAKQDTVFAVIPGEAFDLICRRSQCCPSFLYSLPRKEGYEFYVGQWSGAELHFTTLINIQTKGDSAPSHLILHHYSELRANKGIVLMTAERDPKYLNVQEAQCLANQVQLFYAGDQFHLVEIFNHSPSDFKYMAVVSALEQSRVDL